MNFMFFLFNSKVVRMDRDRKSLRKHLDVFIDIHNIG